MLDTLERYFDAVWNFFAPKKTHVSPKSKGNSTTKKKATVPHNVIVLPNTPPPTSVGAIKIDHSIFPSIALASKPKNTEFIEIRDAYLRRVFQAIYPYYAYLCSLEGVSENNDMKKLIADTIYRYIQMFWCLPSSKDHHHSEPWGGLIHTLDVACREAERMLESKITTGYGVEIHKTRGYAEWKVFTGFMVGMLHDVSKIGEVKIFSTSRPSSVFNPYAGHLIDFYLVNAGNVSIEWKKDRQRRGMVVGLNTYFLVAFLPSTVIKQMPTDFYGHILDMQQTEDQLVSDKESVKWWLNNASEYDSIRNGLARTLSVLIKQDNYSGVLHGCGRVNDEWFVISALSFMKHWQNDANFYDMNNFVKLLHGLDLIAISSIDKSHYTTIEISNGVQNEKVACAFVRTSLFVDTCQKNNLPYASIAKKISISSESKEACKALFGNTEPFLTEDVFTAPSSDARVENPVEGQPETPETTDHASEAGGSITNSSGASEEAGEPESPPTTAAGEEQAEQENVGECKEEAEASETNKEKIPFFAQDGPVEPAEVKELVRRRLNRVRRSFFQRTEKGILWITTDGDLYASYPGFINWCMEIQSGQELSPEIKVRRSKVISALKTLKIILDAEQYKEDFSFSFYTQSDKPEIKTSRGRFLALNIDKACELSPSFTEHVQKVVSLTQMTNLVNSHLGEEEEEYV